MSNIGQLKQTALSQRMAERFGVDPAEMMITLKATAFQGQVSDAQMHALMIVADQYGLNPWTKEIYAFPDKKNGIVPVVGVDGWSRIINEHPALDGLEFRQSENMVMMPGAKTTAPEWMEAVIYRKDRKQPIVIREYLDEVYRPPFKKESYVVDGPWQTHPKRFLRHKTLIQGARIAFGFVGIYDEDEAQRIVEKDMGAAAVVLHEPEDLPVYPEEKFTANFPEWEKLIRSGKKRPDFFVNKLITTNTLTNHQLERLNSVTADPVASEQGHAE